MKTLIAFLRSLFRRKPPKLIQYFRGTPGFRPVTDGELTRIRLECTNYSNWKPCTKCSHREECFREYKRRIDCVKEATRVYSIKRRREATLRV